MPLTTEPTEDYLGIIHTGTGPITGDDLLQASQSTFQLLQNTQNFHYEFVDLSEATSLQMTDEQLEQITEQDRLAATYRPEEVVLIVAPQDDIFETASRWESRVHELGWNTHIARDRAEGLAWLHANFHPPQRDQVEAEAAAALASAANVS